MYATDFKQVGANIERAMFTRGLTPLTLADSLGISEKLMRAIIKGSKAVNMTELSRIGTALDCSAEELLTVDGSATVQPPLFHMENTASPQLREKITLLRTAIDQIHLLEEILATD